MGPQDSPEPSPDADDPERADTGWGDDPREDGDTHEEWLRRQRPPHHGG